LSKRLSPESLSHDFYISNRIFIKQMNKTFISDNDNLAVTEGLCIHLSKALRTVFLSLTVSSMTYVQERRIKVKAMLLIQWMEIKFSSSNILRKDILVKHHNPKTPKFKLAAM